MPARGIGIRGNDAKRRRDARRGRLAAEAFRWATGEDERPAGPDGKPPCSDNNMVLGCLRAKLLAFCGWDDKGAAAVAAGRPGG
jgi:hypothetical protein